MALLFGIGVMFALWSVIQSIPDTDVFDPRATKQLRGLDVLPADDARAIKLQHAERSPAYDVGLFGNSRVVQVSAQDVGLPTADFFNFAVPGTSIRNSLSMLEHLAAHERIPQIVVVGVDNLHLEYFENSEAYFFPERILLMSRDIGWLLNDQVSWRDGMKLVWRHVYMAWVGFENWLTFAVARQRYRTLDGNCPPQYRLDGSRCQSDHQWSRSAYELAVTAASPSFLESVFKKDLRRLKHLQDVTRSRIILFETPLHPQAATKGGRARRLRGLFLKECSGLSLECYPASAVLIKAHGSEWPDATHPPAEHLGRWLRRLVAIPLREQ